VNVTRPRDGGPYPCPCCGFVTLPERGADDINPVCLWEDDGQDDHDADEVRDGPVYSLSLSGVRRNVYRIGAVEERVLPQVRPPTDGERPR
jgi:Cysteine-rich CPCC